MAAIREAAWECESDVHAEVDVTVQEASLATREELIVTRHTGLSVRVKASALTCLEPLKVQHGDGEDDVSSKK